MTDNPETVSKLPVNPKTSAMIISLGKEVEEIKERISLIISTVIDNSSYAGKDLAIIGIEKEHLVIRITPVPAPVLVKEETKEG